MKQWASVSSEGWRFSKFFVRTLFDGQPHLIQRDVDYPGFLADEDVIHRIRQAAYHRKTSFIVTRCPEGFWVKSRHNLLSDEESSEADLRSQLATALMRVAQLEEEVSILKAQAQDL